MKKIIGIFIALALASASLFASPTISDVCKSITEHKVTTGDFSQEKTSAKLKRPLKSTGKFIFSTEGIVWQTLKPFPSTNVITNSKILQISANGNKSVIDGSTNETFKSSSAMLTSIFSGNQAELEKNFTIEFTSNESSWNMKLTPKDSTISSVMNFFTVSGAVLGSKITFDSMSVTQNQTDVTTYSLLNQTYKQELSNAEKAFFAE